jgi:hypothetical protein
MSITSRFSGADRLQAKLEKEAPNATVKDMFEPQKEPTQPPRNGGSQLKIKVREKRS